MKDTREKYVNVQKMYPDVVSDFEKMCIAVQKESSLDDKTIILLNVAAAASSGSDEVLQDVIVNSLAEGIPPEEIVYSLFALTKTVGFLRIASAVNMVKQLADKPVVRVSAGKHSCNICD